MARTLNQLTAKEVENPKPGRHADGGGLYLVCDKDGRARWVFMWVRGGVRREMGLGPARKGGVSLKDARKAAAEARAALQEGKDPIRKREEDRKASAELLQIPTFGAMADELVTSLAVQWRNEKHRAQWTMTLTKYAKPLRDTPVDLVDTAAVLRVLKPLWLTKAETASRLRGRIERVLDAARAKGYIKSPWENPARWRGHLDHLLPKRQKLTRGHHAALPYDDIRAFIANLRQRDCVAALGLEFLILTAARTSEVQGAKWDEIDLKAKVWTVPAARMKAGREHRVPLSSQALQLLDKAAKLRVNDYVFPGRTKDGRLSLMAFEMLLRRMKVEVTTHGFRSTFRDWVGEVSSFPREVAEAALAHAVGDATERAYRRGDALEKRRKLMEAWGNYIQPRHAAAGNNVVAFNKSEAA